MHLRLNLFKCALPLSPYRCPSVFSHFCAAPACKLSTATTCVRGRGGAGGRGARGAGGEGAPRARAGTRSRAQVRCQRLVAWGDHVPRRTGGRPSRIWSCTCHGQPPRAHIALAAPRRAHMRMLLTSAGAFNSRLPSAVIMSVVTRAPDSASPPLKYHPGRLLPPAVAAAVRGKYTTPPARLALGTHARRHGRRPTF